MKPRITLRVNGTRAGDPARPAADTPRRLPARKRAILGLRVHNAATLVRDYRDDDDNDDNGNNSSGAAS